MRFLKTFFNNRKILEKGAPTWNLSINILFYLFGIYRWVRYSKKNFSKKASAWSMKARATSKMAVNVVGMGEECVQ